MDTKIETLIEKIKSSTNLEGWIIGITLMENGYEYIEDFERFMDTHKGDEHLIKTTLIHDIMGLYRGDEHFLPRVC